MTAHPASRLFSKQGGNLTVENASLPCLFPVAPIPGLMDYQLWNNHYQSISIWNSDPFIDIYEKEGNRQPHPQSNPPSPRSSDRPINQQAGDSRRQAGNDR